MFAKILLPTDGSAAVTAPMKAAIEFARLHDAQIVAVTVAESLSSDPVADTLPAGQWRVYEDKLRELARRQLMPVIEAAQEAGVALDTVVAQGDAPAEKILEVGREKGCDVIFIASHGRTGLDRLLMGSQTQKILRQSALPVLVFK